MMLFTGSVTFYNEDAANESEHFITDYVVVCGSSFGEAADRVANYYGINNVENVSLELVNPNEGIACFSDNTITRMIKTEGEIY